MEPFAGEKYILEKDDVPDYENERLLFVVKLLITFLIWTIFMPIFLASEKEIEINDDDDDHKTTTTMTNDGRTKRKKSSSKKYKEGNNKNSSTSTTVATTRKTKTVKVIDGCTNLCCLAGCMFHLLYIVLKSSPDNYYTTRTVFETPLFTKTECKFLIDMAERTAERNYNMATKVTNNNETYTNNKTITGYMKEPYGWQKTRHTNHPTTDLNLINDLFSNDDREWITQKLDSRLSPTIQYIFGVPPSSVRANDIFIVRYDGNRQAALSKHTDDGSITFSTLLSDEFDGGGTKYWNRFGGESLENLGKPFAYILPKVGMIQLFPAQIQHEGVQTQTGRRYLLIGFLAVDRIDPWTQRSTGLSWFASWVSLNWSTIKFKEGMKSVWREKQRKEDDEDDEEEFGSSDSSISRSKEGLLYSKRAGQLFGFVYKVILGMCDVMFDHRFAILVNETSANSFLHDLDEAYNNSKAIKQQRRSSWFTGQQISVNIDGTFAQNWEARDLDDN
jgi:hypothetical protein